MNFSGFYGLVVESHPENKLAISANEYCCGCLSPGCGVCPCRIVKTSPLVLQTCGPRFKSVNRNRTPVQINAPMAQNQSFGYRFVRADFRLTQRCTVPFVTGRGMAVHDGGSVNRRHLGQSKVGANTDGKVPQTTSASSRRSRKSTRSCPASTPQAHTQLVSGWKQH
jgi:hypothetical protein